jgi:cell division protein FtsL
MARIADIKVRSKTKTKAIYMLTIAVTIAMADGVIFLIHFYRHLGAETYDAAVVADDAGDERKAIALFKEACGEGSDLACRAIHEEQQNKLNERK